MAGRHVFDSYEDRVGRSPKCTNTFVHNLQLIFLFSCWFCTRYTEYSKEPENQRHVAFMDFDVDQHLQVLLAIGGRVCACAVTGVPEERFLPGAEDPASDEAVIGLAALSALDLVVTCGQRTVVPA